MTDFIRAVGRGFANFVFVIALIGTFAFLVGGGAYVGMLAQQKYSVLGVSGEPTTKITVVPNDKSREIARLTTELDKLKTELAAAQAAAKQAKSDLEVAKSDTKSAEANLKIAQQQFAQEKFLADKAESGLAAAQAEAKQAKADLASTQADLKSAKAMQVVSEYDKWPPDVRATAATALCGSYTRKVGDGKLVDEMAGMSLRVYLNNVLGACIAPRVAQNNSVPKDHRPLNIAPTSAKGASGYDYSKVRHVYMRRRY